MTLTAKVEFTNEITPESYEHLKYLAEKELNRTSLIKVEIVEEWDEGGDS
tara:strand:- start:249 stop:398 length:150 start_codon:yes stop_codon:yes gene_type:complete